MVGAHDSSYTLSPAEVNFVRKTHEDCAALLFVCGGFLAALQSGLLEGKTATA
jgi:transcriptional regulator GlxA family with amidase domain